MLHRRALPFLGLVGASLLQVTAAAAVAFCIKHIFDALLLQHAPDSATSAASLVAVLVLAVLGSSGLEIVRARLGEWLSLSYVADLREAMFTRILSIPQPELDQLQQGSLLLPFVGDLTAVKKWVSDGLVRLISASVTVIGLLAVLWSQSWPLAAAAGAVIAVAALGMVSTSRGLEDAVRAYRAKRGGLANFVSTSIRGAPTVRTFNRTTREASRLRRRNKALMGAGLKLSLWSGGVTALAHFAAASLAAAILLVGVIEVEHSRASVGLVAAALSLSGLLAGAVRDFGVTFVMWRRAKVGFAKIAKTLLLGTPVSERESLAPAARAHAVVSLERVSLTGILEAVEAAAFVGDVVNVVGASGAGKSTLLSLLARLRAPDEGAIFLSGSEISALAPKELSRRIGAASAGLPLLRGSLEMNLRYRRRNASADQIGRVCELCGLNALIERLPGGLATRLSEGAPELSRRDVQKIQIARAMLGRPQLLILDEVDSHLDVETAQRLARRFRAYPGVIIMVATTPVFHAAATVVWRLEEGRLRTQELGERLASDAQPRQAKAAIL